MNRKKNRFCQVVTCLMVVATLSCALYIMVHQLGLSNRLDFGAGAYFYADIPSFEKYMGKSLYHTRIPYGVHVLLFLAWGWLMFRLWVWIDGRSRRK